MSPQAHLLPTYDVRDLRLDAALDLAADAWEDRIGWTFDDTHVSFRSMSNDSLRYAELLQGLGVRIGDSVGILAPNLPEYGYILFACARIGARLVPINTRSNVFELRHSLSHGDIKVLFVVENFLNRDYTGLIDEVVGLENVGNDGAVSSPTIPSLKHIISLEGQETSRFLPVASVLGEASFGHNHGAQSLETWQSPVLLQYTSGTTSSPKGALLNHRMVLNYGVCFAKRLGVGFGEALLNTQPFYHVGGSCAALPLPLSVGCRVVSAGHYNAERILQLIEREKCVARGGFATMYMLEDEVRSRITYDTSSLRAGWYNGPRELFDSVRQRSGIAKLVQLYGATEGGGACGSIADDDATLSATCGKPLDGMDIRICSLGSGEAVPVGEVGEITLQGWNVMNSYHKNPEATRLCWTQDGRLRTGDLGSLDANGNLRFVGRLKNMIRVGGENVSAEEVEAVLIQHPAIKVAVVIGAPDPRYQEAVVALVELENNASLKDADIISYCKSRLAHFRVPKRVEFLSEWPINGNGKIDVISLRNQYATAVS